MAFTVTDFKENLKQGGARPSLFTVEIQYPPGVPLPPTPSRFLVKGTNIPASTIGTYDVFFHGKTIKIAGDRSFDTLDTTIINDEDFAIRDAMEDWANSINSGQNNLTKLGSSSPTLYKSDAQVTQFSKTGVPLRVYNMVGIFPVTISPVELAWETVDALETFEVTFAYDYFEVSGGITGNAGGA